MLITAQIIVQDRFGRGIGDVKLRPDMLPQKEFDV